MPPPPNSKRLGEPVMSWTKAQRAWNAGLDKPDDVPESEWQALRDRYGCRSIPVSDVFGPPRASRLTLSRNAVEEYLRWKGELGPGKQLRDIIKRTNAEKACITG